MKQSFLTALFGGLLLVLTQLSYADGHLWQPLDKINLGALPIKKTHTVQVYSVPYEVPLTAKEILLYAYARTGGKNPDKDMDVRIYTQSENTPDATQYSYYLFVHGYGQSSWSYNSQTFWLPLTAYRQIRAISTGTAMTGNATSQLSVVGYR